MKQRACRRLLSLLLFAALLTTGAFVRAADPAALQRDAIAKIDAFRDHFRKTFDYTSRIADLADAERELRASVEGFDGRGDLANVALSLIKLGQIQQMQARWDAAGRYYKQAEFAARKANHPAHQAKALMGAPRLRTGCATTVAPRRMSNRPSGSRPRWRTKRICSTRWISSRRCK